jgi:hypothetical protein
VSASRAERETSSERRRNEFSPKITINRLKTTKNERNEKNKNKTKPQTLKLNQIIIRISFGN